MCSYEWRMTNVAFLGVFCSFGRLGRFVAKPFMGPIRGSAFVSFVVKPLVGPVRGSAFVGAVVYV